MQSSVFLWKAANMLKSAYDLGHWLTAINVEDYMPVFLLIQFHFWFRLTLLSLREIMFGEDLDKKSNQPIGFNGESLLLF